MLTGYKDESQIGTEISKKDQSTYETTLAGTVDPTYQPLNVSTMERASEYANVVTGAGQLKKLPAMPADKGRRRKFNVCSATGPSASDEIIYDVCI